MFGGESVDILSWGTVRRSKPIQAHCSSWSARSKQVYAALATRATANQSEVRAVSFFTLRFFEVLRNLPVFEITLHFRDQVFLSRGNLTRSKLPMLKQNEWQLCKSNHFNLSLSHPVSFNLSKAFSIPWHVRGKFCIFSICAGGFGLGPDSWRKFSALFLPRTRNIPWHAALEQSGCGLGCLGDLRPCRLTGHVPANAHTHIHTHSHWQSLTGLTGLTGYGDGMVWELHQLVMIFHRLVIYVS